ncbi:RNA polymerase sporulation sigma factor SigE, partial [Clostridium botulinum]
MSAANIGFAKAINSYSINKNTKFITYASICMNNEILMYIRNNNKLKNQISIYNLLNADLDGNK